jgi:C1A family cysteine protease
MPGRISANGKDRHIKGWRADRPDHRDKVYMSMLKVAHLPPSVDLRSGCGPIDDQGEIGSCTANSATSAMEFLALKMGKPLIMYSRLFLYYAERVVVELGDPKDDSGAQIRDTMTSLAMFGVCAETTWPYDVSQFSTKPPQPAWDEAFNHKILTYTRCNGLIGIKQCLAEGFTVVGGFSVPENMQSDTAAQTGVVNYPSASEQIIGGHAVHFVGYDDSKRQICFQNSWGDGWGDKGFGYLDYQFFENGLASDFWTIRLEQF